MNVEDGESSKRKRDFPASKRIRTEIGWRYKFMERFQSGSLRGSFFRFRLAIVSTFGDWIEPCRSIKDWVVPAGLLYFFTHRLRVTIIEPILLNSLDSWQDTDIGSKLPDRGFIGDNVAPSI